MVRTAAGLLLLVLSLPVLVLALLALSSFLTQKEMGERDGGIAIMAVLALLVTIPLAIAGALLARGKLLLLCAKCRAQQQL